MAKSTENCCFLPQLSINVESPHFLTFTSKRPECKMGMRYARSPKSDTWGHTKKEYLFPVDRVSKRKATRAAGNSFFSQNIVFSETKQYNSNVR